MKIDALGNDIIIGTFYTGVQISKGAHFIARVIGFTKALKVQLEPIEVWFHGYRDGERYVRPDQHHPRRRGLCTISESSQLFPYDPTTDLIRKYEINEKG